MSFLGIDLGTSGLRLLLTDSEGVPVASAEAAYEARHPHPGWSEQDPAQWTDALETAGLLQCEFTPECQFLHPMLQPLLQEYLPAPGGIAE